MFDGKKVAANMKSGRYMNGWTQQDLADTSHVSLSAIASYEVARNVPGLDIAVAICDAFGWTLDRLVGRTVDQKTGEVTYEDRR